MCHPVCVQHQQTDASLPHSLRNLSDSSRSLYGSCQQSSVTAVKNAVGKHGTMSHESYSQNKHNINTERTLTPMMKSYAHLS